MKKILAFLGLALAAFSASAQLVDRTNPVPIFLPISGSFIFCPTTGTFTISAVEQSAG